MWISSGGPMGCPDGQEQAVPMLAFLDAFLRAQSDALETLFQPITAFSREVAALSKWSVLN